MLGSQRLSLATTSNNIVWILNFSQFCLQQLNNINHAQRKLGKGDRRGNQGNLSLLCSILEILTFSDIRETFTTKSLICHSIQDIHFHVIIYSLYRPWYMFYCHYHTYSTESWNLDQLIKPIFFSQKPLISPQMVETRIARGFSCPKLYDLYDAITHVYPYLMPTSQFMWFVDPSGFHLLKGGPKCRNSVSSCCPLFVNNLKVYVSVSWWHYVACYDC